MTDQLRLHPDPHQDDRVLVLATEIVVGYIKRNPVPSDALSRVLGEVHAALLALAGGGRHELRQRPAVPPESSVTREFIVCLEDGEKLKMLKRHLRSKFGLTPDQYRKKWSLPPGYPMVAPGYAERRSKLARTMGLGRKPTYLSRTRKKS